MKIRNVNLRAKQVTEIMLKQTVVGTLNPRHYSIKNLSLGENVVVGVGAISDILGTPNECSDGVTGQSGLALTSKVVRGIQMGFNELVCPSILKNTLGEVFLQMPTSLANDGYQFTAEMLDILRNQYGFALSNDMIRAAWLGAIDFTTSKTLGLCDGYWRQWNNSGRTSASVVGSGYFAVGDAIGTLKNVVMGANILLRNTPTNMKRIFVSDALYRNYREDLKAAGFDNGTNITMTTDGIEMLRYDGIELVVMPSWDIEYSKSGNVFGGVVPDGQLRLAAYVHTETIRYYIAQNDAIVNAEGEPVTSFIVRYLLESEKYRVKATVLAEPIIADFDYAYFTDMPS